MALNAIPGDAAADSFATVAEFDAYQATVVFPKGATATVDQKERALKQATRALGHAYIWLGEPTYPGVQSLEFPRTGLEYNGNPVDSTTIPAQLRDATCELAGQWLTVDPSAVNDVQAQGITKIKAGPVELGFKETFEQTLIPFFVDGFIPPEWYLSAEEAAAGVNGGGFLFRNI